MNIDYNKYSDGLVPAIIQDATTKVVLMLGFMNEASLNQTIASGKVTFFSRTKQRIWTKGEESGNFLLLKSIKLDCDKDTLLIAAIPSGPVCHTGADTCWKESNTSAHFLEHLESVIQERKSLPPSESYIAKMFAKGLNKMAQKVGEEAVEVVIEAKDDNRELFLNESADLLFHYLMLLQAKDCKLTDVISVLQDRHKQ